MGQAPAYPSFRNNDTLLVSVLLPLPPIRRMNISPMYVHIPCKNRPEVIYVLLQ